MSDAKRIRFTTVARLEDIPNFETEAEEHAFWETHEFGDELWEQAEPFAPDELPPVRKPTVAVSIRMEQPVLERVKSMAQRQHKGYLDPARSVCD